MSDLLWTLDELIAATGGTLHGDSIPGISGLNFDSRLIVPGDLFLALPSEDGLRDGHDHVQSAFSKGAALALVSHIVDGTTGPQLLVDDVLQALVRLGVTARDRCANARRIAVTGSVGKTSVTRAILAGLRLAGKSHGPDGSFNNHIGVPLTLARMPRDTEHAVFEIGMNHAGEITPLVAMVAPQVAVITNVGAVHTEHFPADEFGGEAGVARAKAEIFSGVQAGGIAILDRDSRWFEFLSGEAKQAGLTVQSFGTDADATARLLDSQTAHNKLYIQAQVGNTKLGYTMQQAGQHWALNSLAVLLALEAAAVPREIALQALAGLSPIEGRGARHELAIGDGTALLIDESYNANPLSMQAALRTLGQRSDQQSGRRIAVLTDMLELGPDAPARHAALVDEIAANRIDLVFCAGPLMQALWVALPQTQQGGYAPDAARLAPLLLAAIAANDRIMVKGSKGSKASTLVTALLTAYPPR